MYVILCHYFFATSSRFIGCPFNTSNASSNLQEGPCIINKFPNVSKCHVLHGHDLLAISSSKCHHATIWVGAKNSSCLRTISKGSKTPWTFKNVGTIKSPSEGASWASSTSIKASGPSPGSSASSAGSSTSSARWWHQDSVLWVHGPCQLGTRCFKAQTHFVRDPRHCKVKTHSIRGKGTTGGTWWHQWNLVGPLQVHVGINENFISNIPLCHWWQQLMRPLWARSPFVCISAFVFISPPLASMEKGVHIPESEISDHCWLLTDICSPWRYARS